MQAKAEVEVSAEYSDDDQATRHGFPLSVI
jgi:hypothetical protein